MAEDQTASVPADWYPDPYGISQMRWWDGHNWTDSIHPPVAPPPSEVPPAPVSPQVTTPESTEYAVPAATPAAEEEPDLDPFSALGLSPASSEPEPEPEPAAPAETSTAWVQTPPRAQDQIQDQEPPVSELPPLVPPTLAPQTSGSVPTQTPQENPPHESEPTPAPVDSQAEVSISSPPPLPSRREMRLRQELEAEASPPESGISEQTVFPPPTPARAPHVTTEAPTPTSTPAPASGTVPDSSAPTAFNWLPETNANVAHDSAETPTAVTDAWTRKSETGTIAVNNDEPRSTATLQSTVSGWFIAFMPLIAGVLAVAAVKGQENYPRYLPPSIFKWWMLVAAVIGVLYLVTILLAVADRNKLDWAGYNRPAHWAWALLTAPVYLLIRTISIKRETGRFSVLLGVWLALVLVLVGAWFAAGQFAPDLISEYTLPFLE